MADRPTIDEVLAGTLAHRARSLGDVAPVGLERIAGRAERLRSRRRSVATGGSIAVVAAGAAGLLLLPRGDDAPGAGTAGTAAPPYNVWRCTGGLGAAGDDPEASYFSACDAVTIPPELNVAAPVETPLGGVPTTAAGPSEITYTVVGGDSIFSIAEQYGVEMDVLANYNRWEDGIDHALEIDEVVRIPPGASVPDASPVEDTLATESSD
jgi:LysM repeat protein